MKCGERVRKCVEASCLVRFIFVLIFSFCDFFCIFFQLVQTLSEKFMSILGRGEEEEMV